jgi:Uri superfamily endonuclease
MIAQELAINYPQRVMKLYWHVPMPARMRRALPPTGYSVPMSVEQVDKGTYVLVISLPTPQRIVVGRLGEIGFNAGWYAYVGSAMAGFKSRLPRYSKKIEKPHWHIDFLLRVASLRRIVIYPASERLECQIAGVLSKRFESVAGFGCSDCKCQSHLFYSISQLYRTEIRTGFRKFNPGL